MRANSFFSLKALGTVGGMMLATTGTSMAEAASQIVTPVSRSGVSYSSHDGVSQLAVVKAGKVLQMVLQLDKTVSPDSVPVGNQIVGEIGNLVILTDTHPSLSGPYSYCRSGEEMFLRIISTDDKLQEVSQIKLSSCRDNLELASPGVIWHPDTATLEIRWAEGPNGRSENRSYRLTGNMVQSLAQ